MIDRKITRTLPNPDCCNQLDYCTVHIEVKPGCGMDRLTVCAEAGRVETPRVAKREALDSWISFFEDSPGEIGAMNRRCGTNFRSATSAAKYVLAKDGQYHGLDAEEYDDNGKTMVRICNSCGQIRDDIARFFPEVVPLFEWHLNDFDGKGKLPSEIVKLALTVCSDET